MCVCARHVSSSCENLIHEWFCYNTLQWCIREYISTVKISCPRYTIISTLLSKASRTLYALIVTRMCNLFVYKSN